MISETEWLAAFFLDNCNFVEGVETDLARSMREGTTELNVVSKLLRHPDGRLRGAVAWALWETVAVSRFLPAVFQGFDDRSDDVRYWCVSALESIDESHKVEAIVRAFVLLDDDAYWVRAATCDIIHGFGRVNFEAALNVDLASIGVPARTIAATSMIQAALRSGYSSSSAVEPKPCSVDAIDRLREIGYGIQLGYRMSETTETITSGLHAVSDDVRYSLMRRLAEMTESGIEVVRSFTRDREERFRVWSWWSLARIVLEVRKWQENLSAAAVDDNKKVRSVCFDHLTYPTRREVVSTVINACRELRADKICDEAVAALKQMVLAASDIVAIDNDALQGLIRAVDDPNISLGVRDDILVILKSYAILFLRTGPDVDWQAILDRGTN